MSNTLLFWIFVVVAVLVVIWALRQIFKTPRGSRSSGGFWDDIDFGGGGGGGGGFDD